METQRHFYPRSPCGERRSSYTFRTPRRSISIHALLAESDLPPGPGIGTPGLFLSTLSLRRATRNHSGFA